MIASRVAYALATAETPILQKNGYFRVIEAIWPRSGYTRDSFPLILTLALKNYYSRLNNFVPKHFIQC